MVLSGKVGECCSSLVQVVFQLAIKKLGCTLRVAQRHYAMLYSKSYWVTWHLTMVPSATLSGSSLALLAFSKQSASGP